MFEDDEPWHNKVLLIDADIIAYTTSTAHETPFGEDRREAKNAIDGFVTRIKARLKASRVIMCLSGHHNFRKDVVDSYKSNRKKKPAMLSFLREYIQETYDTQLKPNLEADDVMGIMATKNPDKYIICTTDKDLYQIPGWHFNWGGHGVKKVMNMINPHSRKNPDGQKKIKAKTNFSVDPFTVTPPIALRLFYMQILTGDTVDGYYGIPGIGPAKAWEVLEGCVEEADMLAACEAAYKEADLSPDYMIQQANAARILHYEHWDSEAKQPILWTK